jgi:hypothetical protein
MSRVVFLRWCPSNTSCTGLRDRAIHMQGCAKRGQLTPDHGVIRLPRLLRDFLRHTRCSVAAPEKIHQTVVSVLHKIMAR